MENFELSNHARDQMRERELHEIWLQQTLVAPERVIPLADSFGNTHYLKRIVEFGNRWLRVVVNPNPEPPRVVTVFFDRRVQ